MGRSSLIPLGAAALVVAVFAASSCSNDTTNVVIVQPDGGTVCDFASRGCPAGQACLNGICSARCTNGAPCPPGTYCEGDAGIDEVCAPVEAIACTSVLQCPAPQGCASGLCTSSEVLGDGGRGLCIQGAVDDGCSADAVCVIGASQSPSCLGLPACSQDGGCPVGVAGATCNVRPDGGRLIPGKQRVCLVSFCDGNADCPAGAPHCVNENGAIQSFCSPGVRGSPCLKPADCNSAVCTGADGGAFGTCG
ncbi:MAG: hypothetical protein E6J85_10305 [Deltaproteobacteria bacterium]|nr:MAG: hypothetical protein E6J85_10305 [Deltaproteobacteria bacterium]